MPGRRRRAGRGPSSPPVSAAHQPDLDTVRTSRGRSSMMTSASGLRLEADVADLDQPARRPTARAGGWPTSRSRLATLTNTDRVTADGDVRTASATIAWFFRSRPTGRTLMRAFTRRSAWWRGPHPWRRGPAHRPSARPASRPARARRRCRPRAGHRDRLDRLPDAAEVGRLVDDDPGAPVRGDDAHLAAGRQVLEGFDRRLLGGGQPVRARRRSRPCSPRCP